MLLICCTRGELKSVHPQRGEHLLNGIAHFQASTIVYFLAFHTAGNDAVVGTWEGVSSHGQTLAESA